MTQTTASTLTGNAAPPASSLVGNAAPPVSSPHSDSIPDVRSGPSTTHDDTTLRLSFSRVDTYQTCPLQFRYAYVDKLPSQPSPALSWGSALHAALEAWWDQKLPEPPAVDVLFAALYDNWDDSGFEGMERDEKLRWYRHARDVLARHHARFSASYQPAVACEEWFELDLGDGIEVVGSIDHVARTSSGGIGIVDWKTNRRAKSRKRVAGSLQLAIYTLAARELWGCEPEWVALDFVVPGVRVSVNRQDIDTDAALATIRRVAQQIREAAFAPNPSPLCGWCDYRSTCPAFDGDGPDVAGLAVVELKRLQRRRARDEARMSELEALIRDQLGPEATVKLGTERGGVGR